MILGQANRALSIRNVKFREKLRLKGTGAQTALWQQPEEQVSLLSLKAPPSLGRAGPGLAVQLNP